MEYSDELLAVGIKQGNRHDMTTLVERYYEPILGYLFRLCGGQQALAEDMVQETFLRMLKGITSYDVQRPFKPWLYAIATNVARNHFQRSDTRYVRNSSEEVPEIPYESLPEEEFMSQETQRLITQAILTLPIHQREIIVLAYYQELPQKEIAEILQIPVGTVKSRLFTSLKSLKGILLQKKDLER